MDRSQLTASALFRTPDTTRAWHYLISFSAPWEALPTLKDSIYGMGLSLDMSQFDRRGDGIWISKHAHVADSAHLSPPCIIEDGAEIRHGALLRGSVLVGRGAVVGNSCELKNALLFDGVQAAHFNYVGDSILGYRAHLGAGAVTSNVKGDRSEIGIRFGDTVLPTGMRKLGAILGDSTEIGCNAVLNPGTVVGIGTRVYPLSHVRGYLPEHAIFKAERGLCFQKKRG